MCIYLEVSPIEFKLTPRCKTAAIVSCSFLLLSQENSMCPNVSIFIIVIVIGNYNYETKELEAAFSQHVYWAYIQICLPQG